MFRFLTVYATALIAVINPANALRAQENDNGPAIARIVYTQDVGSGSERGLSASLEALKNETERLKRTRAIELPTRRPLIEELPEPAATVRSIATRSVRPKEDEMTLFPNTNLPNAGQSSTKDIHDRIQLLKRIYEQKAQAEAEAEAAAKMARPADKASTATNRSEASPVPETATPTNNTGTAPTPAAATTPAPATARAPQPPSGPADMFELANSLYQTGDLRTAFEVYSQVDRSTVTAAEAVWLDFMMASCHRRMGNWTDAISLYREIANQNTAENLTKPAQVWLKQVELLSSSEEDFSALETQIESLLEKAQVHVTE